MLKGWVFQMSFRGETTIPIDCVVRGGRMRKKFFQPEGEEEASPREKGSAIFGQKKELRDGERKGRARIPTEEEEKRDSLKMEGGAEGKEKYLPRRWKKRKSIIFFEWRKKKEKIERSSTTKWT